MPAAKPGVNPHRLRECFNYDPTTGVITWAKPTSSKRKIGDTAGCVANTGYIVIRLDGVMMLAHRAAWAMVFGVWPEHEIDHINRVRHDNRLANLREATRAQNSRNSTTRRNNPIGLTGVVRKGRRFQARICIDGRSIFLGSYTTAKDASDAYKVAAKAVEQRSETVSTPHGKPQIFAEKPPHRRLPRPSREDIAEWFEYVCDGTVRWRKSPSHRIQSGASAGSPSSSGIIKTSLNGKFVAMHHVVWILHGGNWPEDRYVVRHKNGNRSDNRIENLELATRSEAKSKSPHQPSRNSAGARGVHAVRGRYRAEITHETVRKFIGDFDTIEDAKRAYDAEYVRIHGMSPPD